MWIDCPMDHNIHTGWQTRLDRPACKRGTKCLKTTQVEVHTTTTQQRQEKSDKIVESAEEDERYT